MNDRPAVQALVPWYGSNRILASRIGTELADAKWVGVPFAGSMCELLHINARSIMVNDLHRHLINLANVASHPTLGPKLYRQLRRVILHPDTLEAAQSICRLREQPAAPKGGLFETVEPDAPCHDLVWAYHYFISAWMARNGNAGTRGEFGSTQSVRWDAGGGDSATRVQNAVRSLVAWRRIMRRCSFVCMDAVEFLVRVKDLAGHAIYMDPPWIDAGGKYAHQVDHEALAAEAGRFRRARVVIRYGDHPTIRKLYAAPQWRIETQVSRAQSNGDVAELLIINDASGIE